MSCFQMKYLCAIFWVISFFPVYADDYETYDFLLRTIPKTEQLLNTRIKTWFDHNLFKDLRIKLKLLRDVEKDFGHEEEEPRYYLEVYLQYHSTTKGKVNIPIRVMTEIGELYFDLGKNDEAFIEEIISEIIFDDNGIVSLLRKKPKLRSPTYMSPRLYDYFSSSALPQVSELEASEYHFQNDYSRSYNEQFLRSYQEVIQWLVKHSGMPISLESVTHINHQVLAFFNHSFATDHHFGHSAHLRLGEKDKEFKVTLNLFFSEEEIDEIELSSGLSFLPIRKLLKEINIVANKNPYLRKSFGIDAMKIIDPEPAIDIDETPQDTNPNNGSSSCGDAFS